MEHREFLGRKLLNDTETSGGYVSSLYISQNTWNIQHRVNPNVNCGLWIMMMCQSELVHQS